MRKTPSAASHSRKPRVGRPIGRFTQHRRLDKLRDTLEGSPGGLTLEALAAALRVTTRSVRRYLLELGRIMDLESIETVPGGAHLWRIKPSERGRTIPLRRAQAYALLAARRVFEVIRGSALYDEIDVAYRQILLVAQRPLRASTRGEIPGDKRLEDRFLYLPHPPRNYGQKSEHMDGVFQAVAELRVLRFRYRALGEPRFERLLVHPYAMLLHRGAMYCVAHEPASGETKAFQFDRMFDAIPSETETFSLPGELDLSAFAQGELGVVESLAEKPVRVVVEFDAATAEQIRARRIHPSQKMAVAPDGRVRVSFVIADVALVKPWVLGFGASARVIEPPELAEEVAHEIRRALARYS